MEKKNQSIEELKAKDSLSYEDIGFGTGLRYNHYFKTISAPFFDPTCFASGCLAGMTSRAVVAITDKLHYTTPVDTRKNKKIVRMPDKRDMFTRIRRRGLLYGLFFLFYIPVHRRAQYDKLDDRDDVQKRFYTTLACAIAAPIVARFTVNIWSNVTDAAKANFMSKKNAAKFLTRHENLPGLTTLLVAQPPVGPAFIYHGGTMLLFEGIRRMLRGYESPEDDLRRRTNLLPIVGTAVFNGIVAAGCATVVSSITLKAISANYRNELMRPTALSLPREYVLKREALMVGMTYGMFSLLQPWFSPHHARLGFGA